MPRTKTDYSRTIIYVIKCKDDNITEEYIGSTTHFIERKCAHKICCNNDNDKNKTYNYKIYKFIRDNGGWDNWIMLEIEKYPCQDKNEAHKREEEIRIDRKSKLNSIKAFGAETIKEYHKIYHQEHKDKIKEQKIKYYEEHKEECLKKCKKYREEHKEECLKKCKKYREENKDKIKEIKKQWCNKEFICKCGWVGTNYTKRTHFKKCTERPEP